MQHFSLANSDDGSFLSWLATCGYLPVVMCLVASNAGCDLALAPTAPPSELSAEETDPLTVNVVRATLSENVYETSMVFGQLKARRSSSLGFARGGIVAEVFADVGDFVADGARIAQLEQQALLDQQASLDRALAQARDDLARINASSAQSSENQRRAGLLQQQITTLTGQQEQLTVEFDNGFIVAPYRGRVAERQVDAGDMVPAGRPYITIVEDAPPIVEVNVAERFAAQLEVGQRVWVRRDDEQLQAEVATKSPQLDRASRTQALKLDLQESDQNTDWILGKTVEVQFWMKTDRDGFWLPFAALHRDVDGLWSAFVLEGESEQQIVERRILELVQLHGQHALVRGALQEGDLVISDGLHRVVPGQRVVGNVVAAEFTRPRPPGAVE